MSDQDDRGGSVSTDGHVGAVSQTPGRSGIQLDLEHLYKRYRLGNQTVDVFDDVSLTVASGEFVSILGPSGCGKTTLLHVIAGLEEATQGRILVNGSESRRRIEYFGYMFQKDLLMPWNTVLDNVAMGLIISEGARKSAARERASELLSRYGLSNFSKAYPSQLSGGMRQRAALMRTLLIDRAGILLDEPFGALDALTRATMQDWLVRVLDQSQKTVIFVTHDIDEAILLSDRVIVMSARPGRVSAEVAIDIPRPRSIAKTDQIAFAEYRGQLLKALF